METKMLKAETHYWIEWMCFELCNGSGVIWGRLDDPSERAMESEYFPSSLEEEESKAPKSTYSFANILAFNLALTLDWSPSNGASISINFLSQPFPE